MQDANQKTTALSCARVALVLTTGWLLCQLQPEPKPEPQIHQCTAGCFKNEQSLHIPTPGNTYTLTIRDNY